MSISLPIAFHFIFTLYKNFGFDSGPRDKMNVLSLCYQLEELSFYELIDDVDMAYV